MDNYINYSELELEFLRRMGITQKGHRFVSSNDEYTCLKANYGPVKSFGSDSIKYVTLEYKGKKGGSITFVRGNNVNDDLIPSVILDKNGMVIAFGEKIPNHIYAGSSDDLTEEVQNILNGIKQIMIQVRFKNRKKYQSGIRFELNDYMPHTATGTITNTRLFINVFPEALIEGSLSGIGCTIDGKKEEFVEVNQEEYTEILRNTISTVYKDEPELIEIYLMLLPLYRILYSNTLYLPAINEEAIKIECQRAKNIAIHYYDKEIKEMNDKKQEELFKLNKMESDLSKYVETYPVKGKQK